MQTIAHTILTSVYVLLASTGRSIGVYWTKVSQLGIPLPLGWLYELVHTVDCGGIPGSGVTVAIAPAALVVIVPPLTHTDEQMPLPVSS